ncbi:sugar transferase [Candidatus Saccharibacteria bacterium]|nr:sugar transferase [Candidatus Saccharibacteria bacterium]
MKKEPGLVYVLWLMFGDALAIVASFFFAYLVRTNLDSRPFYFEKDPWTFLLSVLVLIPIWWIILALVGLYSRKVYNGRSRLPEIARAFAASVLGMMILVSYQFFTKASLFPSRAVALWALIFCFVMLLFVRFIARFLRRALNTRLTSGIGTIIIGNNKNTERLIEHIVDFPEDGFRLKGIVAGNSFVPEELRKYQFSSLAAALEETDADVIFQTDEERTEYVYAESIKHHMRYYFVPTESSLSSHIGELELIGGTPAMLVKVTPLVGSARIVKRIMDIVLGLIAVIIAAIPMGVIWLIVKLSDIKHSAFYAEYRLSRYNKKVKIYKFRSIKPEYSGLSPEEAFAKMGRPELIEKYRSGGDYIKDDPRVTKIGHFIRRTSLDELPQLINVLKGDISLVGPRALVPGELRDYGDRSLLLSVKSGLTGLAQVSGRRDISFEERRALDLYYIQNWSFWLDLQILLRTIAVVITGRGAK